MCNFTTDRYLKTVHWAVLGLYSRLFNLIELVIAFLVTGTLCLPQCGMVRGFKFFIYSSCQLTENPRSAVEMESIIFRTACLL